MDFSFGAVVFDSEESGARRYLLVQHAVAKHWGHPKGHPENDESHHDTAIREVGEETGAAVELLPNFSTMVSWVLPDGRTKCVTFFIGRYNGTWNGDFDATNEIFDTRWLPYEDALELITYASDRKVLQEAETFISRAS